MPIEIRELIIKTEIFTKKEVSNLNAITHKDLAKLRIQLLEECKRIITDKTKKNNNKR